MGSTQYFAHVDGLGNVIALTDTAKVVQRTYGYGPWGALSGGTDDGGFAGKDRARFKGALWLGPEAEVYYMRARWYEPKTGRFLSEDPIGLQGGLNLYAFVGDDPVNGRDPLGLCDVVELVDGKWRTVREAREGEILAGNISGELLRCSGGRWESDGRSPNSVTVSGARPGSQLPDRTIEGILNTLRIRNGWTTFSVYGVPVALYHDPSSGPALVRRGWDVDPLIKSVCRDAAYTVRRGDDRFKGGMALLPFEWSMDKLPFDVSTDEGWILMEAGAGEAVLGYSIHQALGCRKGYYEETSYGCTLGITADARAHSCSCPSTPVRRWRVSTGRFVSPHGLRR